MATRSTQSRMGGSGSSAKRKLGSRPSSGSKGPSVVAKVRRSKQEVYGTRSDWVEICAEIKKRAGNKCEDCGSTDRLEVHHTMPASRGGKTIKLYLRLLCHRCHSRRPGHSHMR